MAECFHCGAEVVWDNDFTYEDMGYYDGDGIVHCCHCPECGAEIEYRVPMDRSEDE